MFQKVNAKRRVVIVLVRTPEDLEKCDALVIPGGGTSRHCFLCRRRSGVRPEG